VSIAGQLNNGDVTVGRVVLRYEGHNGASVVGSTNVGANTFQFNSDGVAGVLFNGPVTVYCTPFTKFKGWTVGSRELDGIGGVECARRRDRVEGSDERTGGACGA
jgi:hypothetical protein